MIVVDAALIVDVLTDAPDSEAAFERIRGEELHAPHLLDFEVVSALRGLVLGGKLSAERSDAALQDYADLPVNRWPSSDALRRRVFELRDNMSAYDAAYAVLAEALECPFVTRDARLRAVPGLTTPVEVL